MYHILPDRFNFKSDDNGDGDGFQLSYEIKTTLYISKVTCLLQGLFGTTRDTYNIKPALKFFSFFLQPFNNRRVWLRVSSDKVPVITCIQLLILLEPLLILCKPFLIRCITFLTPCIYHSWSHVYLSWSHVNHSWYNFDL